MKTRAAIAFAAGDALEIAEVDLEGPKAGEVRPLVEHGGALTYRRLLIGTWMTKSTSIR